MNMKQLLPPSLLLFFSFFLSSAHADPLAEVTTAHENEIEPVDVLLFPFFVLVMGIIVYRLLDRYAEWFPYTAAMFILGTIMGVGVAKTNNINLLEESMKYFWIPINSELLLVLFLPGLLFSDASSLNPHLFRMSFVQCLIFAFPMVLAGTSLTALVGYYIFPYGWSFSLAMTFGSILSATDPVAVAALLNSVGAPPRLKVHIGGESLLNDGSAIVFFNLFSQLFFAELGVAGLGEDISVGDGFELFFKMSLGGACTGALFGLGLLAILYSLNKNLHREDNVTQVAATFAVAYTCYFTAEVVWGTSGVISVLTLGVITASFGQGYVNDPKLMEDFWSIMEWLLNTVLFSLGGLVWGSIISNSQNGFTELQFTAQDWGYLILLYVLLTVIRFLIFGIFYPITSRIGLKTNVKETIFQAYSGLRGAVGIALAIVVDNTVKSNATLTDEKFVEQTNKMFGMIGGIALFTVCINGVLAGPLLRYLGLADTSDTRKRMHKCHYENNRRHAIHVFVNLVAQRRFKHVNFAIVRRHVPFLNDMTRAEFLEAARAVCVLEESVDSSVREDDDHTVVSLDGVLMFLKSVDNHDHNDFIENKGKSVSLLATVTASKPLGMQHLKSSRAISQVLQDGRAAILTVSELRRVFLELVRAGYQKQITDGELMDREYVSISLLYSLDMAVQSEELDGHLNDWDYVFALVYPFAPLNKSKDWASKNCASKMRPCFGGGANHSTIDYSTTMTRLNVEKCLAFIHSHSEAQKVLRMEFGNDSQLAPSTEQIISESEEQVKKAEAMISEVAQNEVEVVISHKVCKIILNHAVHFFESLVERGLLNEQEVNETYEGIQKCLFDINACASCGHDSADDAATADIHQSDAVPSP